MKNKLPSQAYRASHCYLTYYATFWPISVTGFNSSQLLLITQGQHCIRELEFETRQISTFSGKCDEAGFVDGEADIVRYATHKPVPSIPCKPYYKHKYLTVTIITISNTGRELSGQFHSNPFNINREKLHLATNSFEKRQECKTFCASQDFCVLGYCLYDVLYGPVRH